MLCSVSWASYHAICIGVLWGESEALTTFPRALEFHLSWIGHQIRVCCYFRSDSYPASKLTGHMGLACWPRPGPTRRESNHRIFWTWHTFRVKRACMDDWNCMWVKILGSGKKSKTLPSRPSYLSLYIILSEQRIITWALYKALNLWLQPSFQPKPAVLTSFIMNARYSDPGLIVASGPSASLSVGLSDSLWKQAYEMYWVLSGAALYSFFVVRQSQYLFYLLLLIHGNRTTIPNHETVKMKF